MSCRSNLSRTEQKGAMAMMVHKPKTSVILVFLAMALAVQSYLIMVNLPQFLEHSGGLLNPDQLIGYGVGDLTELYTALGDEGLSVYRRMLSFDVLYVVLNASWIFLVLKRSFIGTAYRFFTFALFIGLTADLTENIAQFLLMHRHPNLPVAIVSMGSMATLTKFLCIGLILLGLLTAFRKFISGLWKMSRNNQRHRVKNNADRHLRLRE